MTTHIFAAIQRPVLDSKTKNKKVRLTDKTKIFIRVRALEK